MGLGQPSEQDGATDTVVPENDPNLTLETVRDRMASRQHDLRLFLEVVNNDIPNNEANPSMMNFLKYFDTFEANIARCLARLRPASHEGRRLGSDDQRADALATNNAGQTLRRDQARYDREMKSKATFSQSEIQDGDVICFQIELSEKDAHDYESQTLYSNQSSSTTSYRTRSRSSSSPVRR